MSRAAVVLAVVLFAGLAMAQLHFQKPTKGEVHNYLQFLAHMGPIGHQCVASRADHEGGQGIAFARWGGGNVFHGTDNAVWAGAGINGGSFYGTTEYYPRLHTTSEAYFQGGGAKMQFWRAAGIALAQPRVREYTFAATANVQIPDVMYTSALQMQELWGPINAATRWPDVSAFAAKAANVQAAKALSTLWNRFGIRAIIQKRVLAADELENMMTAFAARHSNYNGPALSYAANFAAFNKPSPPFNAPTFAPYTAAALPAPKQLQYDEIILTGQPNAFVADRVIDVTPTGAMTNVFNWIGVCDAAAAAPPYGLDYAAYLPFNPYSAESRKRSMEFATMLGLTSLQYVIGALHTLNDQLIDGLSKVAFPPNRRDNLQARNEAFGRLVILIRKSKNQNLTLQEVANLRADARILLAQAPYPQNEDTFPPPPPLKHKKVKRGKRMHL